MRYTELPLTELLPMETLESLSAFLADPRYCPDDGAVPCFFDIETCGLSAKSAPVYMIGAVQPDDRGTYLFRQWCAERPSEEPALITAFAESLPARCRLLHFNGTTFDLPFLRDRSNFLGLPPFPTPLSLDLYPPFRRLKTLAGLPSCRQRDLEPLAGYDREDPYDGGTLIRFYSEFVGLSKCNLAAAEARFHDLARHNREDLLGLVSLCRLLPCLDIAQTPVEHAEIYSYESDAVTLLLQMPVAWPESLTLHRPISRFLTLTSEPSCPDITLSADGSGRILLRIPLLTEPAKHYFDNYKDYIWLTHENRAVHRSVASLVDRSYRRAAKRDEAFEWSRGELLPQTGDLFSPSFVLQKKDLCRLFPARELPKRPDLLPAYAADLLQLFGKGN